MNVSKLSLAAQHDKFIFACDEGDTETVRQILAGCRVELLDPYDQAIRTASANGHVEIVKLLLADPRVNFSDWGIRFASCNGHIEVVRLLLQDPRVDASKAKSTNSEIQEMLAQWKYHPR